MTPFPYPLPEKPDGPTVALGPSGLVRHQSLMLAREALWGIEYSIDDLLMVADWLTTGRADLALAYGQQTAVNYGQRQEPRDCGMSPDAASWTAEQAGEPTGG